MNRATSLTSLTFIFALTIFSGSATFASTSAYDRQGIRLSEIVRLRVKERHVEHSPGKNVFDGPQSADHYKYSFGRDGSLIEIWIRDYITKHDTIVRYFDKDLFEQFAIRNGKDTVERGVRKGDSMFVYSYWQEKPRLLLVQSPGYEREIAYLSVEVSSPATIGQHQVGDPDYQSTETEERWYDAHDRLRKSTLTADLGFRMSRTETTYDSLGNVLTEIADGKPLASWTRYEGNPKVNTSLEKGVDSHFSYSGDGRASVRTNYSRTGEITSFNHFTYDRKGLMLTKDLTNVSGQVLTNDVFTYDANGLETSQRSFDGGELTRTKTIRIMYDNSLIR